MFDILSFFTEDIKTYSAYKNVMYVFDESRTDEFILNSLQSYRYAENQIKEVIISYYYLKNQKQ